MIKWISKLIGLFKKNDRDVINEKKTTPDADYLYDIMSREILAVIREEYGISEKTMHVVLVDGEYKQTMLVLEKIYQGLNYLTLVTPDADAYEEMEEDIAYDTGLAIGYSNMVPEWAELIIEPERQRIQVGKYRCTVHYYEFTFRLDGVEIPADLLQKMIWNASTEDLRLFGDGEIPEEYSGRIDIRRRKRV